MQTKGLISAGWVILVIWLVVGCAGASPTGQPAPSPSISGIVGSANAVWQQQWEKLVSDAKNEGRVVVYLAMGGDQRQALAQAFRDKYGIDLEVVTGKGSEIIAKVEAERRAGIYAGDVIAAGTGTQGLFKEKGFLEPMDRVLLLPEVKDPKQWMRGEFPFVDKEHMMIIYFAHVGSTVVINTDLVKVNEIKSYRDLLSQKWKGKILMNDPTVTGAGGQFFATNIMVIMGKEFARELARQEPLVMRDHHLALTWVAQGKNPLMLGADINVMGELMGAGAPLKHIVPEEGSYSGGGSGGVALVTKAPHPNAAAVFINWLLSKEGQTVMARAVPDASKRLDVPNEFIQEERRLNPKLKYVDVDTEASIASGPEMMNLAKEIFGPYLR